MLLLLLLGAAAHFFTARGSAGDAAAAPSALRDADIVARVQQLMLLPDEKPTVAVVSDLRPLQSQSFFKNAKLGDILLMYPNARLGVLYDPEQNKIIEVAPITGSAPQ